MLRRSLLAAPLLATPALAQAPWPARPVRVIVPFPPGGSNDAIARPLCDEMQRSLGQTFVIENKGGAGGTIGTAEVARAAPDGQTLMITSSTFATSAAVQATPYDAGRDFAMLALIATAPLVMLGAPNFAPDTMAQAAEHIRRHPGTVDYGSAGVGSIGHMGGALFALRAGLSMQHVPYRGTGPVLNDLASGTIQLTFTTITAAAGLITGRRVKLLGWCTADRPANAPHAPTPRESGLPDYEAAIWWGLLGRRDIPAATRARINASANAALGDSRLAASLAQEGAAPSPGSLEEGERFISQDLARWREVAQAANIRMD
jgi:tripartite-type tricarboxylate transporter receptor subunit TctC